MYTIADGKSIDFTLKNNFLVSLNKYRWKIKYYNYAMAM